MKTLLLLGAACMPLTGCGPGADAPPLAPEAEVLAALTAADADAGRRASLMELGRVAFKQRHCGQCHRFDGVETSGPRLDGVAGSLQQVTDPSAPGGVREVTADRAFLWESIVLADKTRVAGFENAGRTARYDRVLGTDEVAGLIAWLETKPAAEASEETTITP